LPIGERRDTCRMTASSMRWLIGAAIVTALVVVIVVLATTGGGGGGSGY
jgi:hypothetical protein